jgi:protein SCO1/2
MMRFLFLLNIAILLIACNTKPNQLPILGEKDVVNGDTIYHTIRPFKFINQDSQIVTNSTFANKIYVVDFFFTHCPTICPKVTKQMLRQYDKYKDNDKLMLLAFSIDTRNDTIGRLKAYEKGLGVTSKKWHFVTGNQDSIYSIANDYYSIATEDKSSPGGFNHSGRIILVDSKQRVRSFCDGTDQNDVDRFMDDIDILLNEK